MGVLLYIMTHVEGTFTFEGTPMAIFKKLSSKCRFTAVNQQLLQLKHPSIPGKLKKYHISENNSAISPILLIALLPTTPTTKQAAISNEFPPEEQSILQKFFVKKAFSQRYKSMIDEKVPPFLCRPINDCRHHCCVSVRNEEGLVSCPSFLLPLPIYF